MDPAQENRALYATQGGGFAVYEEGRYIWYSEIPDFVNAQVGDPIPDQWGVVAANKMAHQELEEEQLCCIACGEPDCLGLCIDIIV